MRGSFCIKLQRRKTITAIKRLFTERVLLAAFLLEAFIGGLALCATVPPFGGIDEPFHWFRSLQVSRGVIFAPRLGPNNWGGLIDLHGVTSAYWFAENFEKSRPIAKHDAQAVSASLSAKPAQNSVISFPSTASFSPIAYLPAAIPLFAARHLHLPPLTQVAVGRIGQLCFYILLIAATLWILPAGRLVAAGVLTMPTQVHLASCFSSDPVNIGIVSLLIASCLRLRADRAATVHGWRGPALYGVIDLTGTLKLTYLLLRLMAFLCPDRCFATRRLRMAFIGSAIVVSWVLALSWAVHYNFVPGPYWHQGGDPKAALAFVVKHPLLTLQGVYHMAYWHAWYLWGDMDIRFGGQAAPFNFFAPPPLAALEATGLLTLALLSGVRGRHPRIVIACWTGAFIVTAAVLAAFRLAYGPPDVSLILGLQGRYFAPAVLLGLFGVIYAARPIPAARFAAAAFVLCTHAAGLAYAVDRYSTLWR